MDFHSTCLNGILGNAYESNILKSYLESKNLSIRDFVLAVCTWMGTGTNAATSSGSHLLTPDTYVCHVCALVALKKLAYDYRKDIPKEEFPESVTRREDCYWGKECRTQFKNPHHAMYVHVIILITKLATST